MAGVIKLHGGEGFLDAQGYHAYNCPRVCELVFGFFPFTLYSFYLFVPGIYYIYCYDKMFRIACIGFHKIYFHVSLNKLISINAY